MNLLDVEDRHDALGARRWEAQTVELDHLGQVLAQMKHLHDQQDFEDGPRPAVRPDDRQPACDHRRALPSSLAADSRTLADAPTTLGSLVGIVTLALAVDDASVPASGVLTVEVASP